MKESPLRTVQPIVVPAQLYTCGTVASGILALFPAFFAGLLSQGIIENPKLGFAIGFAVFLIFLALFMTLIGWRAYSGPRVTTYRIYRDRIEVEEGLVNRKERTVLMAGVIDVSLTEGPFQRSQGAGTVTLVLQPFVS